MVRAVSCKDGQAPGSDRRGPPCATTGSDVAADESDRRTGVVLRATVRTVDPRTAESHRDGYELCSGAQHSWPGLRLSKDVRRSDRRISKSIGSFRRFLRSEDL